MKVKENIMLVKYEVKETKDNVSYVWLYLLDPVEGQAFGCKYNGAIQDFLALGLKPLTVYDMEFKLGFSSKGAYLQCNSIK